MSEFQYNQWPFDDDEDESQNETGETKPIPFVSYQNESIFNAIPSDNIAYYYYNKETQILSIGLKQGQPNPLIWENIPIDSVSQLLEAFL